MAIFKFVLGQMSSRCRGVYVSTVACQLRQCTTSSKTAKGISYDIKNTDLSKRFIVRPIRSEDIPEVMEMRREFGSHDVASCLQTWSTIDPQGIRVVLAESGEIIGTCSALKQNNNLIFGGLFSFREEYRGCGIGTQVWGTYMDSIEGRNISTNATVGTLDLYRKSGCSNLETEFKCVKNITTKPVNPEHLSDYLPPGVTIEPFDKSHLPYIYAYDSALVGYRREQVLELSCQEKGSRTFVAFKNGNCIGFGSIKKSCLGAGRVGPLYADDASVAEVLLRKLIISLPDVSSFAMMTVSTNIPAKGFLKKLCCPQVEELFRLYRWGRMDVNTSKVFALFDLNFALF